MSVDDDPEVARADLVNWFTKVTGSLNSIETAAFCGTSEQCREYLEEAQAEGVNHLLLNPIARYEEQLEALAEVVGLK
jgi:hypothetical protein